MYVLGKNKDHYFRSIPLIGFTTAFLNVQEFLPAEYDLLPFTVVIVFGKAFHASTGGGC